MAGDNIWTRVTGALGWRLAQARDQAALLAAQVQGDEARLGALKNAMHVQRMRNRHRDRACFMIGSGPSVQTSDLEQLRGRLAFACNRFHLSYPKSSFRPTYIVSADPKMMDDFGEQIIAESGCPVFFVREPAVPALRPDAWIKSRWDRPFVFATDILRGVCVGGGSLIAAIQIACYMGCKRFYLYGVDHSFAKSAPAGGSNYGSGTGEGNHFIPDYRDGKSWCLPETAYIEESFAGCDAFLRSCGGWVKNATHGGKLEVLERISFAAALAEAERAGDPS